jgi:membrane protease YdiL (CAAX protease family)
MFGAMYVFAIAISFISDPLQALVYLVMSLGVLFLVLLILDLAKKLPLADIQVKRPGLELAFGCLLFLIFYVSPYLNLGDKWVLGEILKKEVLYFILPLIILKLRGYSFSSMGISLMNWRHNLKVASVVIACMAIPCFFLIGDAAKLILGGEISFLQALPAFLVYFVHNIARSGLPEEFFYRVFMQTRISLILRSRLGGILITSLIFGLIHIPDIMRWNSGMTLPSAFCSAFFMQAFIGIIFGVLWDRTRNLIPGVLVHSGTNALNNLGAAVSLIS